MNRMIQLALFGLLSTSLAHAEPASKMAWTPEQLNFVKKGNSARGKDLAASCTACHGEQGVSQMPNFPSLAGQLPTYTYKQLQDYKDGSREHSIMTATAASLSDQDMADIAAWFGSLPAAQQAPTKQNLNIAAQLVTKGDGKRTLPPCIVCHGANGQGEKMDIPALSGQQAAYLAETLNAYKNGARHNDVYSRMRLLSQQLSEAEIQELALYYQQLH